MVSKEVIQIIKDVEKITMILLMEQFQGYEEYLFKD